ncbi:signal peptidase I [Paenibacillus alkaliterrae]|uniref:signal peptidase I n=1 Tax=Paenibacillus alkaliterrae TaxID=320909 RepID=UPI001F1AFFC2|nr:signal peptidase I [Paenibacillus alkaliterrae]MCF2941144.1 signal peptidase I [Paenibacillus alkaliterrae]
MNLLERDRENEAGMADEDRPSAVLTAQKRPEWVRELLDWVKTLVIAFAVVMTLHFFVFNLSTVEGHSMEPTLTDNEWLFVNKFVYLTGEPKTGDIVILTEPDSNAKDKKFLVKRVVGVPGDRIEIHDKRLYRNGELIDEPYTDTVIEDMSYGPEVISEGHYFVMGDNRHARASMDSRSFHAVPSELIRGRADYILWPFKEIRAL